MSLRYNGKNIPLAQKLRKNATSQERHLWYDFLSEYPVRFQRQKVIGNFIVDFYCHEVNLAIEIDGYEHFTPEGRKHDQMRTNQLQKQFGLRVLRFSNSDVDDHFEDVCQMIHEIVENACEGDTVSYDARKDEK